MKIILKSRVISQSEISQNVCKLVPTSKRSNKAYIMLIFQFDLGGFSCPYEYEKGIIGGVPKDKFSRLTGVEGCSKGY